MEKLGKVLRKDKEGIVNGYNLLSVILIGKNKTGIGYFISLRGENWQNLEIKKGIEHARSLLPGEADITWVWDRGFDNKKNYEQIERIKQKFVGRFYHNRLIEDEKEKIKIFDLKLSKKCLFDLRDKICWR